MPGFLLLVNLGLFLVFEGVASYFVFGLSLMFGERLGVDATVAVAGATLVLACYGVGKTWLNVRLFTEEYRRELDFRSIYLGVPVVFLRPTLDAAISGDSNPSQPTDSRSSSPNPRVLAGIGLGLPLFVLGGLSVIGNPYLMFLIPVVAFGVLHGVRKAKVEPFRPRPCHVGLALTLTYSFLPLGAALVLFAALLPTSTNVFLYSIGYHWGYSPLHGVFLPLAMLAVVYVSNYCLLLAYDGYRADRFYCPSCGRVVDDDGNYCSACEDARTQTTVESRPTMTDRETSSVGEEVRHPSQSSEYTSWNDRDSTEEMEAANSGRVQRLIDDVTIIFVIAVLGGGMAIYGAGIDPWIVGVTTVCIIGARLLYWRGLPRLF